MSKISEYEREVDYALWRSGANIDRINQDRIESNYYDGRSPEYAARIEIDAQRSERERIEQMRYEQEQMDYCEYQKQMSEQHQSEDDFLPF